MRISALCLGLPDVTGAIVMIRGHTAAVSRKATKPISTRINNSTKSSRNKVTLLGGIDFAYIIKIVKNKIVQLCHENKSFKSCKMPR